MAKWEVQVQNYLGFPDGIAGTDLLDRGMGQAVRFEVEIVEDEVQSVRTNSETFHIQGRRGSYDANRVLLATGLTHLPPDLPGVKECLGKSLFFCKDCDAYRLQGQRVGIIGRNNEAVWTMHSANRWSGTWAGALQGYMARGMLLTSRKIYVEFRFHHG